MTEVIPEDKGPVVELGWASDSVSCQRHRGTTLLPFIANHFVGSPLRTFRIPTAWLNLG